jgi:hypothetical protein
MDTDCDRDYGVWRCYRAPAPLSTALDASSWHRMEVRFTLFSDWFDYSRLSTQHYFTVRNDIEEDTYEPADRWVILFSLAVIFLATGVVYFVFTAPLNPLSLVMSD